MQNFIVLLQFGAGSFSLAAWLTLPLYCCGSSLQRCTWKLGVKLLHFHAFVFVCIPLAFHDFAVGSDGLDVTTAFTLQACFHFIIFLPFP